MNPNLRRVGLNRILQAIGILLLVFVALVIQQGMKVTPVTKTVTLSGGPIELIIVNAPDAGPRCGPDAELEGCAEELPELASHDAGVPADAEVDAWVDPDAWTEMWGDLR